MTFPVGADANRDMFLSYVTLAFVGETIYDKRLGETDDVQGYLYIDRENHNLVVRGEHVALEIELEKIIMDFKITPKSS